MKRYALASGVVALSLLVAGCTQQAPAEPETTETSQMMDESAMQEVPVTTMTSMPAEPAFEYSLQAELADVTNGETLFGNVNTAGEATGTVEAGFNGERYQLNGTFNNLPDPEDGAFYEGWLVMNEPMNVISTGALEQELPGVYTNVFSVEDDLTNHTRYVLTIEPDDGDPAPAEHVLDGMFEPVE